MKIIELDLTGCQYLDELHERIRIAFGFSEDYGRNWSAFDDFLLSECDADEVIIKGEDTLAQEWKKHIEKMHEILERKMKFHSENQKYGLNAFSYQTIE